MSATEKEFKPCRKFPEYEVSADGVVRNRRHKREVNPHIQQGDSQRRRRVLIARGTNMLAAFVDELVTDAWGHSEYVEVTGLRRVG